MRYTVTIRGMVEHEGSDKAEAQRVFDDYRQAAYDDGVYRPGDRIVLYVDGEPRQLARVLPH